MTKHNKGNKAPVAQNTNTPQNAVASAWHKATAGIGSIGALVKGDAPVERSPNLDKDQVSELDKAEPEKKVELEKLLRRSPKSQRKFAIYTKIPKAHR